MAIKSASIEGLDELIEAFMKLPEDAMQYVKDGSNEAGNVVLAKAQAKVPVKTGNLKGKLKLGKAKKSSKNPYQVFSKVTAGKGAAYMTPLELGHHLVFMGHDTDTDIEPRPFLRPAADESKDEVASIIAESLNKALDEMGGNK